MTTFDNMNLLKQETSLFADNEKPWDLIAHIKGDALGEMESFERNKKFKIKLYNVTDKRNMSHRERKNGFLL